MSHSPAQIPQGGEWNCVLSVTLSYAASYLMWILNFFLYPLQICNGCPSLFYQTPPQLLHTHVVCRSATCSYLSFPNGSILSVTNTSIYKSLYFTKICDLHSVNWWASQLPVLQRNMLPPTGPFVALKMEVTCPFKIFVSNNMNIRCHNSKQCLCEMFKPSFGYSHTLHTLQQLMMSYRI